MYAPHFDLRAEPFGLTPDPAYLFRSRQHQEALSAVHYGLLDARGFITLVGEVGTGKTTLLYSLLSQLDRQIEAAYVAYTTQSFEDLLATALRDLNVECADKSKQTLLVALNTHLQKRFDEGRTTALIIDEAQNLSDQTFEELRLLSNFETYERKLLQIVLVGQPELQERLQQRQLRQLRERVSVRAFINPLSADDMERYVAHRLALVGGSLERLIAPAACRLLIRRSAGIPRRANILFHNALLFAYGRNQGQVNVATAREVIAEMDERRAGVLGRKALQRVRRPLPVRRMAAAIGVVFGGLVLAQQVVSHTPAVTAALVEMAAPVEAAAPAPRPEPAHPPLPAPAQVERGELVEAETPPQPVEEPTETIVPAAVPTSPTPPAHPAPTAGDEHGNAVAFRIPPGATLLGLLNKMYGQPPQRLVPADVFEEVLRLNPHLTDIDVIAAGDTLLLPPPTASDRKRAR